ncbi:29319_t:CDS:1, partial [Gigaspora margarita]
MLAEKAAKFDKGKKKTEENKPQATFGRGKYPKEINLNSVKIAEPILTILQIVIHTMRK